MKRQLAVHTRVGNCDDLPFLKEMLFEAFHWGSRQGRPDFGAFQAHPEFAKLLADWGRKGDASVIAVLEGQSIGAAWYRFWTNESHSYGYVNDEIPEVGMAVLYEQRSRGVGRMLVRSLKDLARSEGIKALSLSVDPVNFARTLYETEGFVRVGESGTSWTFVCNLPSR
jgi:GNAT superfamily N-acetyltransferase